MLMKKNKTQTKGEGITISSSPSDKLKTSNNTSKQANLLSFILGNSNSLHNIQEPNGKINKNLIIKSAMFWDTKKRIQKIKSLFLNNLNLQEFDSNEDFQIQQLAQIQLLNLQKNKIIHLHPILHLDTLISLNISHNNIYDLNPISNLKILSDFYASFNKINDTTPLKNCKQLKIINLYSNKIEKDEQTFLVMSQLPKLQELDIEKNPIFSQKFNECLLSLNLKKINGEIITNQFKNMNMNASQTMFKSTFTKGLGASTVFINKNSSMLGTKTTFYNFNKNKDQVAQKQEKLRKLQLHYAQIDQQFERQISKNVKIKSQYQKLAQKLKESEYEQQDQMLKMQQIKNLKRKVKAMKENLFNKTKKGDLLRKMFELQTIYKSSKEEKQKREDLSSKIRQIQKPVIWERKFQADQVIIIEGQKTHQMYLNEQEQINCMLQSIDQSIGSIKNDLQYLM